MRPDLRVLSLIVLFLFQLGLNWADDRGLTLVARGLTGSPNLEIGKQYAVIIGIDRYTEWLPLKSAVAEAKSLKKILQTNYYIDDFFELYDDQATTANIRRLFSETLPKVLDVHDSVLVFYAGHGHLDESQSGFWIPVDGGTDVLNQKGWIPNAQLRNYLSRFRAQRVLLVADSCFSGDLLNVSRGASPTIDSAYFKNAVSRVSRQVLSSGASETVPDDSEFARQLLSYLERNSEPIIDALSIYDGIRRGITKTLPLFGSLPGNETGASFVLFKKNGTASDSAGTDIQPAKGQTTGAQGNGAITLSSKGPYEAWIVSVLRDSNGNEYLANNKKPIVTKITLPNGRYELQCKLPDDVDISFRKTIVISVDETVQVEIPVLQYSPQFKTVDLQNQRVKAMNRLSLAQADYEPQKILGIAALSLGAIGTGISIAGLIDGQKAYKDYTTATKSTDFDTASKRLGTNTTLVNIFVPVGVAGIVAGLILLASDPAVPIKDEINQLDEKIRQLGTR